MQAATALLTPGVPLSPSVQRALRRYRDEAGLIADLAVIEEQVQV